MEKSEENTNIAPISKRISAYLIDILVVFVILSLISGIKFINPTYDKYIESYDKYNEVVENYNDGLISEEELINVNSENYYYISKYSISYNIVIIVGILLYFGVFQKYCNGQTIGKKLMKIKVVDNNTNENPNIWKHLLRTIPMYYIYIGGLIPLIINTILVFILNKSNYMLVTNIVSYIFLTISIASLIIINVRKDKRGLQDLLSNTKVIVNN